MSATHEFIRAVEMHMGRQGRRVGNETRLLCPGHDDHRPSLDVREGRDGSPLVQCRSHGCTFEDICHAIGCEPRDFLPDDRGASMREIESYRYTDEQGRPLFEVVRFDPKAFRQRRPDGSWGIEGIRRVLFRLPQVLSACGAGRTVFVGEGERDALALERLGFAATTSPMGAGKWRDEYADSLLGAGRVVVLPDADEVGREHAETVARCIHRRGVNVVVLDLHPDRNSGLDVRDWLREHTADDLKELLAQAQAFTPSPEEPRARGAASSESRMELIDPRVLRATSIEYLDDAYRVPLGMTTMLVGDGGLGKSLYSIWLGAEITRAGDGVIFASAEDDRERTWLPRLLAAKADLSRVRLVRLACSGAGEEWDESISLPHDLPLLREAVHRLDGELNGGRVKLVVIDPMEAHLGDARDDGNSSTRRRQTLGPLESFANSLGVAALLVHHVNKDSAQRARYRVLGTVANRNAPRSLLLFGPNPDESVAPGDDGVERILLHDKHNASKRSPSQLFRVVPITVPAADGTEIPTARLEYLREVEIDPERVFAPPRDEEERSALDEARQFLLVALLDREPPAKEVSRDAEALGISRGTLQRARKELGVESVPVRDGAGKTVSWKLRLPLASEEDDQAFIQALIPLDESLDECLDDSAQPCGFGPVSGVQALIPPDLSAWTPGEPQISRERGGETATCVVCETPFVPDLDGATALRCAPCARHSSEVPR